MRRSAWLKWARGVEHQQVLVRVMRERQKSGSLNKYLRCDNAGDQDDSLVRVHWHLAEADPIPERWGVLLGAVFTNFRATLDHAMGAAVEQQSGQPERPEDVQFPIVREASRMNVPRRRLRSLVSPEVWDAVEEVQPHHPKDPQRHQPETLRSGSNVDKHRFLHVAAPAFDGPMIVTPDLHDVEVVDDWRLPDQAGVGDVVAGLTMRRSMETQGVHLGATLAHTWIL
jgi:hypothetical protein